MIAFLELLKLVKLVKLKSLGNVHHVIEVRKKSAVLCLYQVDEQK